MKKRADVPRSRVTRGPTLGHDDALALLLAARGIGEAVAHQSKGPGENEGDCCGGQLWCAARGLEITMLEYPGPFPSKTKLVELFRTLGLTCQRANFYADNIACCNDAGQIEAAWALAAEALGVKMSEIKAAEAAALLPDRSKTQYWPSSDGRSGQYGLRNSASRQEEHELVEA